MLERGVGWEGYCLSTMFRSVFQNQKVKTQNGLKFVFIVF